jgi:hypothetical protein
LLFPSRFLLSDAAEGFLGYVKAVGLIGLLFIATMLIPRTAYGATRYSLQIYENHYMNGLVGQTVPQLRESSESFFGGRVYPTQYTPPVMPPASGQGTQGGTTAPVEQSRLSLPTIVPFIAVSERYDSNVLFSRDKRQDYITNISPGARWNFLSSYIDGNLAGTLIAERYVLNPGLSYVGTSGVLNLGLDNVFGRAVRGWSVRVSDSFLYTPQQPAFISPEAGNQVPSSFVRGIQASRANSLSNVGGVTSTFPLAPDTTFLTSYTHQILRFFGGADPSLTIPLFNVTTQTISAGPQYRTSSNHTIGLTYQYQNFAFGSQTVGTVPGDITIHGGMLTWLGRLSPSINFELGAGASVIKPTNSNQIVARAVVQYVTPLVTTSLSYSRGVVPSYFQIGGALINDLAAISLTYNFSPVWYAIAAYNYQKSNVTGGSSFRSESHGPMGSLNYRITPYIIASGQFFYYQLVLDSAATETILSRETVTFSIRAEWN